MTYPVRALKGDKLVDMVNLNKTQHAAVDEDTIANGLLAMILDRAKIHWARQWGELCSYYPSHLIIALTVFILGPM